MGKKFEAAKAQVEDRPYALEEALPLIQNLKFAKFDETVGLSIRLGVDPKHADQMVRGTVVLPHGLGKTKRVVVIAGADKQKDAEEAGADVVGGEELVEKIAGGWVDFESVVATPDMMRAVGKLGKVLGPRGLMPNPKTGTVTPTSPRRSGNQGRQGGVPRRQDRHRARSGGQAVVHGPEPGGERLGAARQHRAGQAIGGQGQVSESITVSSTMGPGVRVDTTPVVPRRSTRPLGETNGSYTSRQGYRAGRTRRRRSGRRRRGDPRGLQGHERAAGHRPAPRAADVEGVVPGGQEHVCQAGAEGHPVRGALGALRRHHRGGLHRGRPGRPGEDPDHVHEDRAGAADQGGGGAGPGHQARRGHRSGEAPGQTGTATRSCCSCCRPPCPTWSAC